MDTGTIASWHLPADINETIIKKYLGFDVFITRNIYNGKPNVHFFLNRNLHQVYRYILIFLILLHTIDEQKII
jgi:hypothetical protein